MCKIQPEPVHGSVGTRCPKMKTKNQTKEEAIKTASAGCKCM